MTKKIQRNDPCPCGSGAKYKKCCGLKEQELKQKKGLRGHFATHLSGSMKDMAGRVFKVLTATSQPASDSTKEQTSVLPSSERPRGYSTLEELIGMEEATHTSNSSCCSPEGRCCCHEEGMHSS